MKETLSSLSQKTGFSITTISRVLSGKADEYRISQETRDAVTEAARKYNYFPNMVAQNLRKNRTNTIGLLIPAVNNPYFAEIASVVINEARRNQYTTIVLDSAEDVKSEEHAISTLMSHHIDGLIAVPCGENASLLEDINNKFLPVIQIDRYYTDSALPYVTTNNYNGSVNAVNHLIQNGHRRIACIQGAVSSAPNHKRVEGYLNALKKAGLQDNAIIVGNEFSVQNGYIETKLLLNMEDRPTAIFALSNTIALGAVRAIREAGLSIPEDISILAFDNNIYMDFMTPAISRISQPTEEMGKMGVKLLLDCIRTGTRCKTKIELSPTLVLRESIKVV